jgi:hypothetical protein
MSVGVLEDYKQRHLRASHTLGDQRPGHGVSGPPAIMTESPNSEGTVLLESAAHSSTRDSQDLS